MPSTSSTESRRIGLISDTHGLLRRDALEALRGSDCIVHAGDIGGPQILQELGQIAPVTAVRGNNDEDAWASELPLQADLVVDGVRIRVVHALPWLKRDPRDEGVDVVVVGHSHKPHVSRKDGVLFVNPGSAGPRRFKLPIALGRLHLFPGGDVEAEIVTLDA